MNRRIESYKAMGLFPGIMILDGVSLHRQLRRRPGDNFHFSSYHSEYIMNKGGQIVSASAGQLCAGYMSKTANLARYSFVKLPATQPRGEVAQQGQQELTGMQSRRQLLRS
eukprot:6313823-Pyramimonas_sp.AAC.1